MPVHITPLVIIIVSIIIIVALEIFKRFLIRAAAKRIARNVDQAFAAHHVFRRVKGSDFHWLNHSFYDGARADIEAQGFEWLADIEDETLSQVYPNLRTFVRICLSPDRRIRAAIYEIVPGGPQGKALKPPVQTFELISEASDGTAITTTTAPSSKLLNAPAGIIRNNLPQGTDLEVILQNHERIIEDYLEVHHGQSLEKIETYEEVIAAWQKGIDRQRERLQKSGGITRQELMRIGGAERAETAQQVFDDMEKLKKKE